jgi:hypothetical protein
MIKVDWKKLGQPELAKIAAELNLEVFTSTIIGEDRRVQDIVENFYSAWLEVGYVAASGLELVNLVLTKQAPYKVEEGELIKFDPDEILANASITWDELNILDTLLNVDLPYLLIIKFRTGIGQYNIFDYLPLAERKRVIDALKVELSTSPKVETPPVAENPNVETTTTEGGAEAANLT